MKVQTSYCDICKSVNNVKERKVPVIFTTEQTEGRSHHPYFEFAIMDICLMCMDKLLSGIALYAYGAQGFNTYYFDKERLKLEHHRDTTIGLWATDLPDKIPEDIKQYFFEIKD